MSNPRPVRQEVFTTRLIVGQEVAVGTRNYRVLEARPARTDGKFVHVLR